MPTDETHRRRLTVTVVLYNSEQLLDDFCSSLAIATAGLDQVELVAADNASSDRSIETIRRLWPGCTVVEMGENRGYSAGINAAVAAAKPSDAILVLNDDIRMGPGSVTALLDALDPPTVSIAVPRLVDGNGDLLKSLKREPHPLRTLGEAFLGGDRSGRYSMLGEVVQDGASYHRRSEAVWASGCAWLISRECWDTVGEWDESFFLYAEETDYALRSRDAGHRLWLIPDAEAVHLVGPSHENPRLWSMSVWNRYRLVRRRHGRLRAGLFWLALVVNESIRALMGRRIHRAGLAALLFRSKRPIEVR